jgi:geranylgeranyl pyrophosphate synthase
MTRMARLLDELLETCPGASQDASDFVRSGKRLRAQLMFAAADGAGQAESDDLVRAAAAIELVHAASLLHDDIVDRSAERRGRPALHRVCDARGSALTGVCLVQRALELVVRLPRLARARIAVAAREAARGQVAELLHRRDMTLSPADSVAIMERKTSAIFGLSSELGGMLGGREAADCARLRRVGTALGVAFQIADDVDDLYAGPRELGRPPGADLGEGVVSLPLALALRTRERDELKALLGRAEASRPVARCRALLERCGALRRSYDIACRRVRAAHRALALLPETHGTRWMAQLLDVTEARIARHVRPTPGGCEGRPLAEAWRQSEHRPEGLVFRARQI